MSTKAGQKQIFDEWLSLHKGLLFKVVRSYARSIHDQDDLFQEIGLKLWHSISKFRGEAAVTTWIYRVALNAAISWSRKEHSRKNNTKSFKVSESILRSQPVKKNERVEWLYERIGKLDALDCSICLLMLDGFSYKEISDTLGISEGNVGVKVHRIKSDLIEQSKGGIE